MATVKKLSLKRKAAPVQEEEVKEVEVTSTTSSPVEVVEETPKENEKLKNAKAITKVAPRQTTLPSDEEDPGEDEVPNVEASVVVYNPAQLGGIDGEIESRDLLRPYLSLVQSTSSNLEEKGFTPGQIALNGELLVWEKGFDPLKLTLLTGRKRFIQKLSDEEYREGLVPRTFDSLEDAASAGLEVNWVDRTPPEVDPGLFCLFLVEQPEITDGNEALFNLEFGDRRFALAEMRLSGVNYRSATSGRWLITQSRSALKPDTREFELSLTASREKQKSGNIVTVASFRNMGHHKDEKLVEWIKQLG